MAPRRRRSYRGSGVRRLPVLHAAWRLQCRRHNLPVRARAQDRGRTLRIARHERRVKGDPPRPLPEHRAAKIAAVHGRRAKLYEKRQQLLNLGPDSLVLLTELVHREPQLSAQRVEQLFVLLAWSASSATWGSAALLQRSGREARAQGRQRAIEAKTGRSGSVMALRSPNVVARQSSSVALERVGFRRVALPRLNVNLSSS